MLPVTRRSLTRPHLLKAPTSQQCYELNTKTSEVCAFRNTSQNLKQGQTLGAHHHTEASLRNLTNVLLHINVIPSLISEDETFKWDV